MIAAYDKAVVFEESTPGALKVAKALPALNWSHGGLLLLGVRKDGSVCGVAEGEVDGIFQRFGQLCAELSRSRVEIGQLRCGDKAVVFIVFNMIPRHTPAARPLYRGHRAAGRGVNGTRCGLQDRPALC
ncbi:hypothetical protein OJ996_01105 [Luteolibacter sp. GHJ8]|uniref:DNA-binding protein n=1 Tax=Luteolibacter rhizosphaerae TaxID=2989719 RepID=A0ABT3FY27_9BACT|nr:hypothetical protein [Luteolibacter rhizosphaerae]MCW1912149.1 hypothetical protein [Luteolibacter rhizosphaerae]